MPIRAVLFDVFGTLMPYKGLPREIVLSRRAARVGLTLSSEQVAGALARLAAQDQAVAMGAQLGNEDVPRNRRYWEATFARVLVACGVAGDISGYAAGMYDAFLDSEDYSLDPEAAPTLEGLKRQGCIVGIVSNAPARLERTLARFGLVEHMAVIVGSMDVGLEKPSPAIFEYALRQIDVPAAQAAYVGDEYVTDVLAARAAGLLGILLDRTGSRPTSDVPRIERLRDLLAADSPLRGGQGSAA